MCTLLKKITYFIQVLQGAIEGSGVVQPGEDEAQGGPFHPLQLLEGGCRDIEVGLFCSEGNK